MDNGMLTDTQIGSLTTNPLFDGDVWGDWHSNHQTLMKYDKNTLKSIYTIEDIVDIYGFEEIENFIRKKKIERIKNEQFK